jgi:hypothetical protein
MEPARAAIVANLSAAELRFLADFESCALPEEEWTHLAHVRVAWICLSLAAPRQALARIRDGILRYNTVVLNRPHKYHETVTVAFARLVADRMKGQETWGEFVLRIADIVDSQHPLLLNFYSEQLLNSADARQKFVAPDRLKLPEFRD